MFDCEPAERALSPSGGCNAVKPAWQPREDSGCNAVSDSAQAPKGTVADNAAPDWLATQAVHAPDWLATQAATQIMPTAQMAESQPFPFDFAALLDDPKPVSSPRQTTPAAAKETPGVLEVEGSVSATRRYSAALHSPTESYYCFC